ASIFSSGSTPASESLLAFTIIMNRIVVLLTGRGRCVGFCSGDERGGPRSTRQPIFLARVTAEDQGGVTSCTTASSSRGGGAPSQGVSERTALGRVARRRAGAARRAARAGPPGRRARSPRSPA